VKKNRKSPQGTEGGGFLGQGSQNSHNHLPSLSMLWCRQNCCLPLRSRLQVITCWWRAESNFTTQRVIKQVCLLRRRVQGGSLLLTCTPSHEACTYLLQSLS